MKTSILDKVKRIKESRYTIQELHIINACNDVDTISYDELWRIIRLQNEYNDDYVNAVKIEIKRRDKLIRRDKLNEK